MRCAVATVLSRPNKALHPTVCRASLRLARRPAGDRQAVGPAGVVPRRARGR